MARRRTREPPATFPPARRSDSSAYSAALAELDTKRWGKASDVLDRVVAVRTMFPGINLGSRVGGLPLRRVTTIFGPSHQGKSVLALGLIRSFIEAGHLGFYVDAEHATPEEFATDLLLDLGQYDNFRATRPESYEDVIDTWADACRALEAARKHHPGLAAIHVTDTINKLVPKGELKSIAKKIGAGEDLAKGHQGRDRARLNQAWMDHVVPRLGAANMAFVVVAQERGGGVDNRGYPVDGEPKGGDCLFYDASLVIRTSKAGFERQGEKGPITAWKYRARIKKNKVGAMDDGRHTDTFFHLSTGKVTRFGFDVGRDALLAAVELGVVSQAGSWYTFGRRRWQGIERAILHLEREPDHLRELLDAVGEAVDRKLGRRT